MTSKYGLRMNRSLSCLIVFALAGVPLCAVGQSGPRGGQSGTTIWSTSDLVVLDVTVADAQQSAIHHLAAEDFTILEDGKPQAVKVFEEHSAAQLQKMAAAPKFGPGMFSNFTSIPTNSALNILLFDKLNTPMNAQTVVRDQVLKYLKEAPAGTRIAIFSLTTELKMLQGFTSDPELLRALVEGKKGSQGASSLMNDAMRGDQPGDDDAMMDMANDVLGNDPDMQMVIADLQQFEAETQSFQLQLRQRYTLDALNQLARYMSNLPGRKNLIWFSGSFPITIMPDPDLQNPFGIVASAEDEFRETVDMLARSEVAVYPIDARGLTTLPMIDASQTGSTMMRTPNGFGKATQKFFQNTAEEHGTMEQMASATGGRAFVNTNALKESVQKAIDAGSNYYTVAYTPANRNWNGAFRKIEVKVDRPGVTLAYRRGYFADDLNKSAHRKQTASGKSEIPQYSAMRTAMLHGGPEPTELIFVADVRPSTAEPETTLAPGNQAGRKTSGPFRRYTVTFLTNPREIECDATPDGVHHCAFEFLTFVYGTDGALINMQTNGISASLPAAEFEKTMARNFSFQQQISVPVKGEYYLRIGMRDGLTDNVGAVEVPIAAVAKLKPVDAPETAPATDKPTGK
jgi:VWFA-related protein